MKIIFSDNAPFVLKYPTGKKDGNKLGKRKRYLYIPKALMMQDGTCIVHTSMKKYFEKLPEGDE